MAGEPEIWQCTTHRITRKVEGGSGGSVVRPKHEIKLGVRSSPACFLLKVWPLAEGEFGECKIVKVK